MSWPHPPLHDPDSLLRTLIQPRLELLGRHAIELVDDLVLAFLDNPAEQITIFAVRESIWRPSSHNSSPFISD
jgi:hypothetical protein